MNSRQLLAMALDPNSTDADLVASLKAAVASRMLEDQWVDWKSGELCNDLEKFNEKIRKMVCGFANAEGGLLVVGIAEGKDSNGASCADRFLSCTRPAVHEQASRALGRLAARPVVRPVDVDGNSVLMIAADRSDALLRVVVKGEPRAFLRIGESTHLVPHFLELDLVLGRRERVTFDLAAEVSIPIPNVTPLALNWSLTLHNETLAWADAVRVGIIGYGRLESNVNATRSDLSRKALEEIDRLPPRHHPPSHLGLRLDDVGPLDAPRFWVRVHVERKPHQIWCGAAYVLARNAPIQWFSLRAWYNDGVLGDNYVRRHRDARPIVRDGGWDTWLDIPEERRDAT